MRPRTALFSGIAATMAFAGLWHGPAGGAGARIVAETEALTQLNLDYYEMHQVDGWMERGPLTRRIWLAGEANDFQEAELRRIIDGIPNVADVQWWREEGGTVEAELVLPLVFEAELAALSSFALGLLLTYLVALRRRAIRGAIV